MGVCVCELDALLLIRINKDRERKTYFYFAVALHTLMLDKLLARLARGPINCEPLDYGLPCLNLNPPLVIVLTRLIIYHE
jgi:hypothetical protein